MWGYACIVPEESVSAFPVTGGVYGAFMEYCFAIFVKKQ